MTNNGRSRRNLAFFLAPPLGAFLLLFVALAIVLVSYQSRHNGRIFTGISVMGVDLSGLEIAEAEAALSHNFSYATTQPKLQLPHQRTNHLCGSCDAAAVCQNTRRTGSHL